MQKEETRQGYSAEYAYDASGASTYFRAGVGSRSAVLSDGAAAYTPGISERRNNVSRFYTLNAQGSTTQLTDSSQDETASFSYDAWGNRIGTRNSDDPPFLFGGGFGYETDDDAGLIWVGSKPFFPKIGRFISRSGGGSAVYGGGYAPVGNNPVVSPGGGSAGSSSGGGPSGPQIAPLEMVWVDPGVLGIGIPYKPWYQHGLDFGWDGLIALGDAKSGGITIIIRQWLGVDDYVDYGSPGYIITSLLALLVGGKGNFKGGLGANRKNNPKWPNTSEEMDKFLGFPGTIIPDGPYTGRGKVVWRPGGNQKITYEQHPYHWKPGDKWVPRHHGPHFHYEPQVGKGPRSTFLPGDDMPGY